MGQTVSAFTASLRDAAFCQAAEVGDSTAVKLLVAAGAAVDAAGPRSFTALHSAALHGNSQVVQLLLGASVDGAVTRPTHPYRYVAGPTALHMAVACHQQAVVQLLAAARADVNAPNAYGISPVRFAGAETCRRDAKVLQALLAAPQLKPETLTDAVRAALEAGRAGLAVLVLKAMVDSERQAGSRSSASAGTSVSGS